MHAAADVEQQQQVQRVGLVLEMDDPLRRVLVVNLKIGLSEPGNRPAIMVSNRGIDFYESDAGVKSRRLRG